MNHFGIILNSNLKKNSFSILDNQLGRIECIAGKNIYYKAIINGAIINYEINKWKSLFILQNIELLSTPCAKNFNDILFLHHILEICIFFIPINDNTKVQDVFNIIKKAYIEIENNSPILNKALLVKELFIVLEIHPDEQANEQIFKNSQFLFLISSNIDNNLSLEEKINYSHVNSLKLWLNACIKTHPFAHKINTRFLNKLDSNYE